MADEKQLALLRSDVEAWNRWREENRALTLDLAGADLSETDLTGANLAEANLSGADLCDANLSEANIKMANLEGADCAGASFAGTDAYKANFSNSFLTQATLTKAYLAGVAFDGADLRGARFEWAKLCECSLRKADCTEADFTGADLSSAVVVNAKLASANLSGANLHALRYGSYREMHGRYLGIRGLDSCFGNSRFVRDAKDQDYLDTLERELKQADAPWKRWIGLTLFRMWGWIDYGRSFAKPLFYAFFLTVSFGVIYAADMYWNLELFNYSGVKKTWLTPYYFSVATYTTLGYGDIAPRTVLGQVIVMAEVMFGYLTLGLLLSILANKVARRA